MSNTKGKYIMQTLAVVSILAMLLVSVSGCKKKQPENSEPSSTGETVTDTTGAEETTTPENTTASKPADSTENTTAPEDTTVSDCAHNVSNWIVDEPSNCTKEGSRYKKCTLCGEKLVEEAIEKTAHTASEWKGTKATCTAEGAMYQECTQCKEKIASIAVDKADHKTYEVKGQGYTVGYRCSVCHQTIQEQYEIPAAGTVPYQTKVSGSTCTITGLGSWTGSELILPSTIDGKTVTAIGSEAFKNNTSIKTVYIPKTVTEIGEKAFSGCSALTAIVYEGAMKDWSLSVVKGNQWNQNTGNYQILCNNRILSK